MSFSISSHMGASQQFSSNNSNGGGGGAHWVRGNAETLSLVSVCTYGYYNK